MTVTETPPAETDAAAAPTPVAPPQLGGLAGVLGTGDHKTIGRMWIAVALLNLLVSGLTGALLSAERLDLSSTEIVGAGQVFELFSFHATTGFFLVLLPLLIGIATVIVPLQVGANTVAFPRAAAASFWTFLVSGAIVFASYMANGGPFGGESDAVDLFVAAMVPTIAALVMAAVCIATTGIALRAPGMEMRQAPLFTWSTVVAAAIWILTLPMLAGILVLAYFDLRYGPTFLGGADGLHNTMSWIWTQPTVYAAAIPALGIIGDTVAVAGRTRFFQHRIAMGAIGGFAIFSFGVWFLPAFTADGLQASSAVGEVPITAFSLLIGLPVLVLTGLVVETLRRGSVQFTGPLLWSLSAVVMLLAGVGNGLLVSLSGWDLFGAGDVELLGTTAQSAHTHYVTLAALLAALGGISHWAPKLVGKSFPDGASKALALGGLAGTVLLSLPDLVTGFLDQQRFGGALPADDVSTIEALNAVSTAGGVVLILVAVGFALLLVNVAITGADAEDDPWGGNTLEWATSSPPPLGNFDGPLPAITSEAPLYDARYAPEADS